MTDRRRIIFVTAFAMCALAAPVSALAQETAGHAEFWSSSFERFQRTLTKTPPPLHEAAGAHLLAPPDVLMCDPQNLGGSMQAEGAQEPAAVTTAFSRSADFRWP
jgi:hypothetical protein